MISTHYLKSEFMWRSSTVDVLQTLSSGISDIDKLKSLQVSSDETNVNLLFLNNFMNERKEEKLDPLIDMGTCGFYTIHRKMVQNVRASSRYREDLQLLAKIAERKQQ